MTQKITCWACQTLREFAYSPKPGEPTPIIQCSTCKAYNQLEDHEDGSCVGCFLVSEPNPSDRFISIYYLLLKPILNRYFAAFFVVTITIIIGIFTFHFLIPRSFAKNQTLSLISQIFTILSLFNISYNFILLCFREPIKLPKSINDSSIDKTNLTGYKICKKCNQVKPPRTYHCNKCKKCIFDLDHHCTFIGRCVGFHNRKNIILFQAWSFVTSIFMFILSYLTYKSTSFLRTVLRVGGETIRYVFFTYIVGYPNEKYPTVVLEDNDPYYAFVFLYNIFIAFAVFFFIGVSLLSQFYRLRNGMTHYEENFGTLKEEEKGLFKNLKRVFGSNVFLWPFASFLKTIPQEKWNISSQSKKNQ